MALTVEIPAFARNAPIPNQFSRQGANVSPRVEWHGAPLDTRSFALVVEDPDAPKGTFRHWAAFDIPSDAHGLQEGAGSGSGADPVGGAIRMAYNDFGDPRYDGPQPPPGHGVHHYHFRLFALDTDSLDLPPTPNAKEVLDAALEHSLAEAETVGTFER